MYSRIILSGSRPCALFCLYLGRRKPVAKGLCHHRMSCRAYTLYPFIYLFIRLDPSRPPHHDTVAINSGVRERRPAQTGHTPLDRIDLVLSGSLVPYVCSSVHTPPTRNLIQGGTTQRQCGVSTTPSRATHHYQRSSSLYHCVFLRFCRSSRRRRCRPPPRCTDDRCRRTRRVGRPPILRQVVAFHILPAHPFRVRRVE